MNITINGLTREIRENITLQMLLVELNLIEGRVALECNGQIVPPNHFSSHTVQDGDVIEIVRFVGGG